MSRTEVKIRNKETGAVTVKKVKPDLNCYANPLDIFKPNLYALPSTRKPPINDDRLYGHEADCADCFVELKHRLQERLVAWYKPSLDRKWQTDYARPFGVRPDRIFEIDDVPIVFALEVDRGSEEDVWRQIWPKLQNYLRLSQAVRPNRLAVVFTTQAYRYDKESRERLEKILPTFHRARAGRMFLITTHEQFLADPLGPIFETDAEQNLSILDL
jgi:hypothetical protein